MILLAFACALRGVAAGAAEAASPSPTPPPSRGGLAAGGTTGAVSGGNNGAGGGLWGLYYNALSRAKYIDLTHVLKPNTAVWKGFKHPQVFRPSVDPSNGKAYTYNASGFEATSYQLTTDQYGTQLDPPAHWNPYYPAIDELPPTYAVRPLAVISIAEKVKADPGYQLTAGDVVAWEGRHGRVPEGSVVMVRSDWYKKWDEPGFAEIFPFPGVTLGALKLLHLERGILFHGHEALDTDTTPTLEGEAWLLRNGYTQAEAVRNLDKVPPTGCLVAMGFPRLAGGTGGYARFVAMCPEEWPVGETVAGTAGALPRQGKPLRWDGKLGYRVRR